MRKSAEKFYDVKTFEWPITLGDLAAKWDQTFTEITNQTYPPYNLIKRTHDDGKVFYFIDIALAGFSKHEVEVGVEDSYLTISKVEDEDEEEDQPWIDEILHRGIGKRAFELKWKLFPHFDVVTAVWKDGILRVMIEANLPEKNSKTIPIT